MKSESGEGMETEPFYWPKPQLLLQVSERDCGVSVFAALTGISQEELSADLPNAPLGEVSVDGWIAWLESKGFSVLKRQECPADIVPCAHLVAPEEMRDLKDAHWIFRDKCGNVHDPSGLFHAYPANHEDMRSLKYYERKVLTRSVSGPGDAT
jgi:hypothetical protein